MSVCEQFGKDRIVFITKEDFEQRPNITLPELPIDNSNRGMVLPNGELNFSCPCLGNMTSGPCAYEFRESLTCFHYSTSENKGEECVDKFIAMHECMAKYPNLYAKENEEMNREPSNNQPDKNEDNNDDK